MSASEEMQLSALIEQSRRKYDYFLMAFAGSCIALCVGRTTGVEPRWDMVLVGLGVLCWAFSILSGVWAIRYSQSCLETNMAVLQVQRGVHPKAGKHPQLIEAASEGLRSAYDYNQGKESFYSRGQLYMLIAGAALFLIWHVVDMFLTAG